MGDEKLRSNRISVCFVIACLPPATNSHFDFLFGSAAVESYRDFASRFNCPNEAVELVGRFHRMPIELGDKVSGTQPI